MDLTINAIAAVIAPYLSIVKEGINVVIVKILMSWE